MVLKQGSIEQLTVGTITNILFFTIQLTARPFRQSSDNFFASGCSLLIVVMFICAFLYKLAEVTDRADIRHLMSNEQRRDFVVPYVSLSAIMIAICIGALVLLGVILAVLFIYDQQRTRLAERAAKVSPRSLSLTPLLHCPMYDQHVAPHGITAFRQGGCMITRLARKPFLRPFHQMIGNSIGTCFCRTHGCRYKPALYCDERAAS